MRGGTGMFSISGGHRDTSKFLRAKKYILIGNNCVNLVLDEFEDIVSRSLTEGLIFSDVEDRQSCLDK